MHWVLGLWLGCLWNVRGIHVLGTPSSKAAPFSLPDVPVFGTTLVARGYYFGLCATFSFQSLLCTPLAIIQDFIFTYLLQEAFLLPN